MLTFTNIMAGGRYLVADSNLGILSAAIIDKTCGNCSIIQLDMGNTCNGSQRHAVYALNYPESVIKKCLSCISIINIQRLLKNETIKEDLKIRTNQKLQMEEEQSIKILKEKNIDALLIMSKNYDLCSLVEILLNFLFISRPFAIFSPYIEPLKQCYVELKPKCVYLRLSETFLRKYQVLNDRTRPEMTMNSSSGYILTGIKVET